MNKSGGSQAETQGLTIDALRERLSKQNGPEFWRSLEELAQTKEFQELVEREFPRHAPPWMAAIDRRNFLKVMAASLAMAGLAACRRQPIDKIIPYVNQPREIVPGESVYYATALTLGGYAIGVLAQSFTGRPTKIEGNPDHPASLGSTDAFLQAMLLDLYDPDRSQAILHRGLPESWENFTAAVRSEVDRQRAARGAGLRILTPTTTSPSLISQIKTILQEFPQAKWHVWEAVNRDNARAGSLITFGAALEPVYHFDKAKVIVSLDSDFLTIGPGRVRYTRDFSAGRRLWGGKTEMSRLYAVQSSPNLTAAKADNRLTVQAHQVDAVARALASALGLPVPAPAQLSADETAWVRAAASDLLRNKGTAVVVPGEFQTATVHAIANAINVHLASVGTTLDYIEPPDPGPNSQTESLRDLVAAMQSGVVETLIMIGGNPAFDAPADFGFSEAISKVRFSARLAIYADETTAVAGWHVPMAHELESWGDARAFDGTASIIQPLIQPLLGGRSPQEFLAACFWQEQPGDAIVRGFWQTTVGHTMVPNFEQTWRQWLRDGVIPDTVAKPVVVSLQAGWAGKLGTLPPRGSGLEIIYRPDQAIWDGRFANNAWLQELPRTLTRITWDNVAAMSLNTAAKLGIKNLGRTTGQGFSVPLVELRLRGRSVGRVPAWVMPGHPEDSITVTLGYGRTIVGHVGRDRGFDAFSLRAGDAQWFDSGLEVVLTDEWYPLATTQHHFNMMDRHLVRVASLEEYKKNPGFAHEFEHEEEHDTSMYPPREYKGYSWAMVIDTTTCTGCNACVAACQAENNIPSVGKTEVLRGRAMHWIRIDRYYSGDLNKPDVYIQPVTCMHCEQAPCEVVCPVAATVHSAEGLNEMVYNRCVGTRYCSNNCPYKVRRFNFLLYSESEYTPNYLPIRQLVNNPNVTVRGRGVMEKCTYCVQRINAARINAKKSGKQIKDKDLMTACQQACPAQAIVFGNMNDKESQVAKLRSEPLNYAMLKELHTIPRTTYLAQVRNPNPEAEAG